MRKTAYIKAIEQAKALPDNVPELQRYFSSSYSPRGMALQHIVTKAREDTKALFASEFVDVYNAAQSDLRADAD